MATGATPRFDSVWLRPAQRDRKSQILSRDQIVGGAIELLDESGVAGLTMRSLAKHLGSSTMALYYHVANKEDLIELAIDEVFGEAGPPDQERDWRAGLHTAAHALFDAFLNHPWVAGVLGSCPPVGPNSMTNSRGTLEAFTRAGLTGEDLDAAMAGYYYYVIGAAITEASWEAAGNPDAGMSAMNVMSALYGTDDNLARYLVRNAEHDARARFDMGLRRFLDTLPA